MSANVDDNQAGPPRLLLGSILATRTANTVRYSMMNIFILVGIMLGYVFLRWTHRVQQAGKTPLLALEVLDSPKERAAVD